MSTPRSSSWERALPLKAVKIQLSRVHWAKPWSLVPTCRTSRKLSATCWSRRARCRCGTPRSWNKSWESFSPTSLRSGQSHGLWSPHAELRGSCPRLAGAEGRGAGAGRRGVGTSPGRASRRRASDLGKAMDFGPHMQNFAEVVRDLLEQKGAVQVRDAAELEQVLGELLADEPRREQLGRNALKVVRENFGAIDRTADMIANHLASSGYYLASRP